MTNCRLCESRAGNSQLGHVSRQLQAQPREQNQSISSDDRVAEVDDFLLCAYCENRQVQACPNSDLLTEVLEFAVWE